MRPYLVVLVMFLVPFAGCLDDNDGSLLTAQEALPRAENRAEAWNKDAHLLAATSFELGPEVRAEIAEELESARQEFAEEQDACAQEETPAEQQACLEDLEDFEHQIELFEALLAAGADQVGDGASAIWIYMFGAPATNQGIAVVVNARKVLFAEEGEAETGEGLTSGPIVNWTIDSDEAAKAATEGDDEFRSAVGQASASSFSLLIQAGDWPLWLMEIESDEGDATVFVDATDGSLVDMDSIFDFAGQLFQEWGTATGSLLALVGTTDSAQFDVELEGHQALAVHLSVSPPPPAPVSVVVTDSQGGESRFTVPLRVGALQAEGSIVIQQVPAGAYDVQLSTPFATQNDWELTWCTDGFPLDSAFISSEACRLVPDSNSAVVAPSEMVSRWLGLAGL